jgi:hypothetical protein
LLSFNYILLDHPGICKLPDIPDDAVTETDTATCNNNSTTTNPATIGVLITKSEDSNMITFSINSNVNSLLMEAASPTSPIFPAHAQVLNVREQVSIEINFGGVGHDRSDKLFMDMIRKINSSIEKEPSVSI